MKVKILVVDDEIEICQMLSRHFSYIGYEVDSASNGFEAMEKLAESSVQVVISDIVMPKMDGVKLLRAIKNHYPMIHTIMITGYVTLDNALSCMRLGADTCVFKPFEDLTELEDAVANAVKALKQWKKKLKMLKTMNPEIQGACNGR